MNALGERAQSIDAIHSWLSEPHNTIDAYKHVWGEIPFTVVEEIPESDSANMVKEASITNEVRAIIDDLEDVLSDAEFLCCKCADRTDIINACADLDNALQKFLAMIPR